MDDHNLADARARFARRALSAGWRGHVLAALVLVALGLVVWPQRFGSARGFLLDDHFLLAVTYDQHLEFFPRQYLPWAVAHRPIGRDAFTLLVRLFGERELPMIWVCLAIHLATSVVVWESLRRVTESWWASTAGAVFFLLSESAYLPIYWPVDVFDTIATLLSACLLLFVAFVTQTRGRYRPWLLLFTLPLLLAAVKTKESVGVVIVPLSLMVFFSGRRAGGEARERRFNFRRFNFRRFNLGALLGRLKEVSPWEVAWLLSSVALLALLASTVITTLAPKDPAHPYYTDYSPAVIGRSYYFYLNLLFYRYRESYGGPPLVALLLVLLPFALALVMKSRWMFYGWLWYVVFTLPLAALRNHYNYIYYPYPAAVGVALAVAALFARIEQLDILRGRAPVLRRALPAAFVLLLALRAFLWIRYDAVPRWFDDFHARSAAITRSLRQALPRPPSGSQIVLVIPELSQFNADAGMLLRIIYHDQTLDGARFADAREAEDYLSRRAKGNAYLATWNGEGFDVKAYTIR